jgi:VIT1/CCC1 family predicted Fe2+/Mn2+ transporter
MVRVDPGPALAATRREDRRVSESHRRRAADTLARRDPGAIVYGAVVTAASLAAVSANISHVQRVALSVGAVVAVYWLAHVYTETQEMLFHGDRRPLYRRTPHAAAKEVFILVGAVPAVVVYLLLVLLGMSASGAAYWALWFSVAFLAVIGYLGAHRADMRGWRLVLESAGAASLGILTVLGKLFLH